MYVLPALAASPPTLTQTIGGVTRRQGVQSGNLALSKRYKRALTSWRRIRWRWWCNSNWIYKPDRTVHAKCHCTNTCEPSMPTESGRKKRDQRINTRFAPGTEDGRGDAGWDAWTHVARSKVQRQERRHRTQYYFLSKKKNEILGAWTKVVRQSRAAPHAK